MPNVVIRDSNSRNEIDIHRSISSLTSRSSSPNHSKETKGKENVSTQNRQPQTDLLPKPQPPALRSKQNQMSKAFQRSTISLADCKSEDFSNYVTPRQNHAKVKNPELLEQGYEISSEYNNFVEGESTSIALTFIKNVSLLMIYMVCESTL